MTKMRLKYDVINSYCDNQSVLNLATNLVMKSRVKHIDIKYQSIRQVISDQKIKLVKREGKLTF